MAIRAEGYQIAGIAAQVSGLGQLLWPNDKLSSRQGNEQYQLGTAAPPWLSAEVIG